MASAQPTEQLHAELECPVCTDWYTDPVELSCGHNFCRRCLLEAFRARPEDSDGVHDSLDCPVCRKCIYTNEQRIGKMPVNLKLRNIISAIQAKEVVKPTECEEHKKPHVMFCHDCKDVKCLTCFTKSCKHHNSEEIEDIGSQLRSVLKSKKDEIEQKIEKLRKLKEKTKSSSLLDAVENDMISLLEQVESLRTDLIDKQSSDYEKYADSLKAMGNTSNASLVQNKTKIENTSYTEVTPNKLKAAEQIYEEIRSDVQKMNEKLKKLLKENGRNIQKKPVPTPRPRMGDGQDANSNQNASPPRVPQQMVAPDYGLEWRLRPWDNVGDAPNPYSDYEDHLSADFNTFMSAHNNRHQVGPGRPPNGLLTAQMFLQENFNSVSYIPQNATFYANTSDGCQRIITLNQSDQDPPSRYLDEVLVIDMCALQGDKVLVLSGQQLGIFRSPGSNNGRLYNMPAPASDREMVGLHRVSCIWRDNWPKYAVTDLSGAVCFWCPTYRCWEDEICVYTLAGYDTLPTSFAFNMCVTDKSDNDTRNTIMYFTLYYQGEVFAYDDDTKQILWHNHFACHHPAGITSTPDKLLVCEALESSPCVVVLGHNGALLQKVMQNYIEGPCWGIVSSSESLIQQQHEIDSDAITVAIWHQSNNSDMYVDVFHLNTLLASV